MYQHQPQRSAIPKVIGILMVIFASLGLLGGLMGLAGGGSTQWLHGISGDQTWRTIELVINVVGLAYGALHLYAGVRCLGYKSNAVALAKTYAIVAMSVVIVNTIIVFAWINPIMEQALSDMGPGASDSFGSMFGGIMIAGTLLGLAWPTIVLILMTRPAAKAACVNEL